MQFTLIAVQRNGEQLVLGTAIQEFRLDNMVREMVRESDRRHDKPDTQYRSYLALGTTSNATTVMRMNARGDVVSRSAGIV